MIDEAVGAGLPEWLERDLASLHSMFARGLAATVSPNVRNITGREPRTIEDFAAEYTAVFSAAGQRA